MRTGKTNNSNRKTHESFSKKGELELNFTVKQGSETKI